MCSALFADEKRIALSIVARFLCTRVHSHETAVCVRTLTGTNALRDNRATRIFAEMNHLGSCVSLLMVVCERDGVELADRIIAS